jgi:hypothetical protein
MIREILEGFSQRVDGLADEDPATDDITDRVSVVNIRRPQKLLTFPRSLFVQDSMRRIDAVA